MNPYPKLIVLILSTFLLSCDKIIPDLERNNPNDLKDGAPRLAISEVNILNGSGQLTTARVGSTVYINVAIIHYGQSGSGIVIKDTKGVFSSDKSNLLHNITPAFGTPISFYNSIANRETDLTVGQTAYAVAFPQNYGTYAFRCDIDPNASRGEEIKFKVELTDNANRRWQDEFKIIID